MKSYFFILFISISVLFSCGEPTEKTANDVESLDSINAVSNMEDNYLSN